MAEPVDGIQEPYPDIIYISASEHLKLYKKAIYGLPESNRYDMTRSKWTDFYQELEDDVYTFGYKAAVMIVTTRDGFHIPTEVSNTILSYPATTHAMVDSHGDIMWANNSVAGLGRHPTENYGSGLDDREKKAIISQQCLESKML